MDLELIGKVDPAIAGVAADLGYGIGLKGGIARKLLKILHGTPEPPTGDFDVDCILVAEAGLTAAEETELRAAVSGAWGAPLGVGALRPGCAKGWSRPGGLGASRGGPILRALPLSSHAPSTRPASLCQAPSWATWCWSLKMWRW